MPLPHSWLLSIETGTLHIVPGHVQGYTGPMGQKDAKCFRMPVMSPCINTSWLCESDPRAQGRACLCTHHQLHVWCHRGARIVLCAQKLYSQLALAAVLVKRNLNFNARSFLTRHSFLTSQPKLIVQRSVVPPSNIKNCLREILSWLSCSSVLFYPLAASRWVCLPSLAQYVSQLALKL